MAYIFDITIYVTGKMPKTTLELLRDLFMKKKVLATQDVIEAVNAKSRMTAYRYLKKLDYLSSYTHARQFYTLKNIPEFDKDGLWHYGDVSFSKYGTLVKAIIHLVNNANIGKTSSDLEKQQRIYVQNALLSLVKDEKIMRKELNGVYVYFSSDPEIACKQMENRNKKGARKRLPNWIVAEILIETIRCSAKAPQVGIVIASLSKRRSLIMPEQVKQVFEENDLEKKTLH